MKVPINLASQPYENLRPFYLAAGIAAVLLTALALLVVWNVRQNDHETRRLTEQSDRLEKDLQSARREQRDLQQWLARPEVLEIRDRSAFLNSIIARKSLSWTQMFMDMEKILPERVQVTAIHPSLNKDQQAELKLTVSAPSVQPLVEFLKSLESAPQFGAPVVESQRFPAEKAADTNIVLELSVLYHQTAEAPTAFPQAATRKGARELPAALADAAPERPASPLAPPPAAPAPSDAPGVNPAPPAPSGGPVWNPAAPPLSDVLGRKQARPRRGTPLSGEEDQ
jgi:type IV pilus assembly protein PilN